jgi:MFS family permease
MASSFLSRNASSEDDSSSANNIKTIIFGSSLGTAFEWYDFFVYGTLATMLGPLFFSKELGETGIFLAALATYGTGLLARPIGSAVFGRLGDMVGRKKTFLITILLMGCSTASIGLLPTYETVGGYATLMLVALRCVQGVALGGEYGGAATYVAEHTPAGRRGYATGWVQLCATMGLLLSLVVVLAAHRLTGESFKTYGWRIPFLLSVILVAGSVYIRMKFEESPIFLRMKSEGKTSKRPLFETFAQWRNLRLVLLSLFGVTLGVGIIWYTSQFYALIFMQKTLRVEPTLAFTMMSIALICAMPFFVFFGWLSDKVGRKPVMLAAFGVAAFTYMPLFHDLTHFMNPALEAAMKHNPVVLLSNQCEARPFSGPRNDCERIKDLLVASGVQHELVDSPGEVAMLKVGESTVIGFKPDEIRLALDRAGYPDQANPDDINYPMAVATLFGMTLYVCASYGVLAAYLVELFPARVRCTSISMPYHVGAYFGGFMLYFATLISSITGNIFDGLWYSIGLIAVSFAVALFGIPETKGRDIYESGHPRDTALVHG